jgi:hypothetical protein
MSPILGIVSSSRQGFTPTSIAGCRLWLDAADTSSIAVSGTAVTQWNDKSGQANHFTQVSSSARPVSGTTTQNSKNVVVFDGVNDCLNTNQTAAYWKFMQNTPATIFFAINKTTTKASGSIMSNNDGTSSAIGFGVLVRNANTDIFHWNTFGTSGNYVIRNATSAVYTTNSFFYSSVTSDPTNGTAANRSEIRYKAGSAIKNNVDTDTASSSNPTYALQIGADGASDQFLEGNIGEIIIYDTALNSTNRAKVETYLATKWGV